MSTTRIFLQLMASDEHKSEFRAVGQIISSCSLYLLCINKTSLTVGPRKVSHILSKSVVFHTDICNSPGIEFCTQSAVGCPFFFFPLWLFSCLNSICWKGYPFPLLRLVIRVINRGPINVSLHFWPLFICVIQVTLCKNIQTTTWCEFNWNYRESIDQ